MNWVDPILNPEQKGPAVPLVSLLNNYVNKSPWIAENVSPVMLPTIHFVLNHGMLGDLYVRGEIGRFFDICYSVHNSNGHKQKLDRLCFFQPKDLA